MLPSIVQDITNKILSESIDSSALIVGKDASGYHIFAVYDPGEIFCTDAIGFAAVGIGRRHAEAQFMLAGYSQHVSYEQALLLTYRAKKRAEVSPGVGPGTNMWVVVANGFGDLDESIRRKVEESFEKIERAISKDVSNEENKMKKFLPEFLTSRQSIASLIAQRTSFPEASLDVPLRTSDVKATSRDTEK